MTPDNPVIPEMTSALIAELRKEGEVLGQRISFCFNKDGYPLALDACQKLSRILRLLDGIYYGLGHYERE